MRWFSLSSGFRGHRELFCSLDHPGPGRMVNDAREANLPGMQLDGEQDVQHGEAHRLDGEGGPPPLMRGRQVNVVDWIFGTDKCHSSSSQPLPSALSAAWCPLPLAWLVVVELAPTGSAGGCERPMPAPRRLGSGCRWLQAVRNDELALAGAARHRRLGRVALQRVRRRELLDVVAELTGDPAYPSGV
jgi:hypothetical protein